MLPADTFWQHLSPYAVIFPAMFFAIGIWLLWRRRRKIKELAPVQTALDFRPSTQKFLLTLFVLGLLLLMSLSAIDLGATNFRLGSLDLTTVDWLQADWWNNHAYIPNILAGATGFCIGAPFALVILATFAVEREENAALARVNEMSELAWENFLKEFRVFCTPQRMNSVMNTAVEANEQHNNAYNYVTAFINIIMMGHPGNVITKNNVRTATEAYKGIQASYEPFKAAVDPITKALMDPQTIETQWSALTGAWQTLDQFIRLQRLEQCLEWFIPEDRTVYAEMRKLLALGPNPLTTFAEIHGYLANTPGAAKTMVNTVGTVMNYRDWGEEELQRVLSGQNQDYFGYSFVAYYGTRASEASQFLLRLDQCVTQIIDSNWPKSARVPLSKQRH